MPVASLLILVRNEKSLKSTMGALKTVTSGENTCDNAGLGFLKENRTHHISTVTPSAGSNNVRA